MLTNLSAKLKAKINEAIRGEGTACYKVRCIFSNPNTGYKFSPQWVSSILLVQDFLEKYMDTMEITISVNMDSLRELLKNAQDLKCTVILTPVEPATTRVSYDQDEIVWDMMVYMDDQPDLDKIFTFADDADDQKALEEVVRNGIVQQNVMNVVAGVSVENATNVKDPAVPALVAPFRTKIGANGGLADLNSAAASMNDTTVASLWVANGDIAMNNVMDTVFEGCKSVFAGADDEGEFGTGSYIVTLDYKYEVSVSVVNVPVKYDTTKTGSVNFVAVTVTRTAEVA